ncbi:MAG: methyltransferase domain-containing protein [Planctomycetota bacterium]|jgi:SAM-dependent methyltransferase
MLLAQHYLGPPSRGLEIGASATNPFPGLLKWNLEQPEDEVFADAQERLAGERARVDVVADAARLPVRDGSLPWLLTSHVLEHMPDTISALLAWDRAVAVGGTLFLIVPHKERTFDSDRPRTELAHHLADWALGMDVAGNPMVPTSHYHVWITEDLLALIDWLRAHGLLDWELLEIEDTDSKVGNGFTIVVRRRSACPPPPPPDDASAWPPDFHLLTLDLPFQVPGRTLEYTVHGAEPHAPPGLPRGRWRAVPIRAGVPPRAGPAATLDVGDDVPPPVLEALEHDGLFARFSGAHLTETTYLTVDLGDGTPRHVLPGFEDGRLVVDTTGLHQPSGRVRVAAVNLPPGGGQGPWLEL